MHRRRVALRGLIAGLIHMALFGLAFPPYNLWPLAWVALVPITLHALRTRRPGTSFLAVWIAAFAGYLWLEWWISGITLTGYPFMALILGIYPAAFVWMVSRLRPAGQRPRIPGLLNVLLVPILWTALEFLRGDILFGGYAWFLLAHPAINWLPLAQPADLLGTYFVSFLMAVPAGFIADALTLPVIHDGRITRTIRLSFGLCSVLVVTNLVYGWYQLHAAPAAKDPGARTFTMLAVQTNVPQSNKMSWTNQQQLQDFRDFLALTVKGISTAGNRNRTIRLIAWPETMTPGYVFNDQAARAVEKFELTTGYSSSGIANISGLYYHETLSQFAKDEGIPLLVGATVLTDLSIEIENHADERGNEGVWIKRKYDRHYNSAVLYQPDGSVSDTRYDKLHLTPFGEIMPYIHYWPWLQDRLLAVGASGMSFDLSAGSAPVRFTIPASGDSSGSGEPVVVATPICFESTDASVCRKLVIPDFDKDGTLLYSRSDLLINLTNDGWFGSFRGGRWQHLQIARFRCIENRVPMVRCANTGISASIDSAGRLAAIGPNVPPGTPPQYSAGSLVTTVVLDGRYTVFQHIGSAFGWLVLGLAALLVGLSFRKTPGASARDRHALR